MLPTVFYGEISIESVKYEIFRKIQDFEQGLPMNIIDLKK